MATREVVKLITRARRGEAAARLELGRLYLSGTKGIRQNSAAALNWFVEAWKSGCREAAQEIACIESVGVFPEHIRDSYLDACMHAAASGSANASFALAEVFARQGKMETAAAHYRSAAEQGHARAAYRLGCLLLEHPIGDAPLEAARNWLEEAAERGESRAVAPLAHLLDEANDPAAIPWLRILARGGEASAMASLARMLLQRPTEESLHEARALLLQASRKGNPTALWLWGRMQVKQFRDARLHAALSHSPRKAIMLLERAAEMGVAEAHWDLARLYALPQGAQSDARLARVHLEAAAAAGIPGAQLKLAHRLIQRRDDPDAWVHAGELLVAARADEKARELADRFLGEIADEAPAWSAEMQAAQRLLLPKVEERFPKLAARLRLAAAFGLTTRETMFVDVVASDRGWCVVADLRKHFVYRPWRLIRVATEFQRAALELSVAVASPVFQGEKELLAGATTRARARRLQTVLLQELQIDPAVFIHDWQPPG